MPMYLGTRVGISNIPRATMPTHATLVGRFFGKNGTINMVLILPPLPIQTKATAHCTTSYNHCFSKQWWSLHIGEKEAVNTSYLTIDKVVGEPYITSYVNHVSGHPNSRKAPHSVVPDIHARNFTTGKQTNKQWQRGNLNRWSILWGQKPHSMQ